MKFVFMEESGFSSNWKEDYEEQPDYVLAAITIDCDKDPIASHKLGYDFSKIPLAKSEVPLGKGFEIKAKEIARGGGWRTTLIESLFTKDGKKDGHGLKVFP